jgi:hypothetical protein
VGVVSAQHGDLVTQHQDLDVLGASERASSASQLSTRVNVREASRKATADDHAVLAVEGDVEGGGREGADQRP